MTSARLPYYPTPAMAPPTLRTTDALSGAASFNTGTIFVDGSVSIVGTVFANQPGTLFIEQSYDQQNWDVSTSYNIAANDGKGFTEDIVADYARVRYVNGASAQTVFRLNVSVRP